MKPKNELVDYAKRPVDDVDIEVIPKGIDTVTHDCPKRNHSEVLGLMRGEVCPFCHNRV